MDTYLYTGTFHNIILDNNINILFADRDRETRKLRLHCSKKNTNLLKLFVLNMNINQRNSIFEILNLLH